MTSHRSALLTGKVAIVTGASSGIGRATALLLARAGASVVLAARREERLRDVAAAIERAGGRALALPADLAQPEAPARLVQQTLDSFGRVDVLINNAGFGHYGLVESASDDTMAELWAIHVMAPLRAIRAVLPHMRARGSGHIINVASVVGRRAFPLHGPYAAVKAAVIALTEALRGELAGSGVYATVVLPGSTRTEFFDVARSEIPGWRPAPMGVVQSPEAVARAILRCLRRPTPEVNPFPPMRPLLSLSVALPYLGDVAARRYFLRRTRRTDP